MPSHSIKLGHDERVLLYVMGLLEELQVQGLIPDCGFKIHEKGRTALKQIKAEGWKPTDAEINQAMAHLIADAFGNNPQEGIF